MHWQSFEIEILALFSVSPFNAGIYGDRKCYYAGKNIGMSLRQCLLKEINFFNKLDWKNESITSPLSLVVASNRGLQLPEPCFKTRDSSFG